MFQLDHDDQLDFDDLIGGGHADADKIKCDEEFSGDEEQDGDDEQDADDGAIFQKEGRPSEGHDAPAQAPDIASSASGQCPKTSGSKPAQRQPNRKEKVCFCCECVCVKGHMYCDVHKRTRDVIRRQLKTQDKEETDWVKRVEKIKKTDPDEQFKQLLLKVELLCPSLGERTFRPRFDFVSHVKEWSTSTGVRHKYVARFMSWKQFLIWSKENNSMDLRQCTDEWALMEKTKEWPRKQMRGELYFLVHMWDEVEGFQQQMEKHSMLLTAKPTKIPKKDEDLAAMKDSLMTGHSSLGGGEFAGPGADLAKLLAKSGNSMLDSSGLGIFGGTSDTFTEKDSAGKVVKSSDRLPALSSILGGTPQKRGLGELADGGSKGSQGRAGGGGKSGTGKGLQWRPGVLGGKGVAGGGSACPSAAGTGDEPDEDASPTKRRKKSLSGFEKVDAITSWGAELLEVRRDAEKVREDGMSNVRRWARAVAQVEDIKKNALSSSADMYNDLQSEIQLTSPLNHLVDTYAHCIGLCTQSTHMQVVVVVVVLVAR